MMEKYYCITNGQKNGFTLIEVLITLAITGAMLSAFFLFAQQSFRRFFEKSNQVHFVYEAGDFLYSIHQQVLDQKDLVQGLKKSSGKIVNGMEYTINKPVRKSALHAVSGLHIEKVVRKESNDSAFISLVWLPEESDE